MQTKFKKSSNKNKTIWDTVNLETNKTGKYQDCDGNSISDRQEIANAFNKYFLTTAKSINTKQKELIPHNLDNTTPLQYPTL